jgi:DNA-binding Lrp family transcriptional regulator
METLYAKEIVYGVSAQINNFTVGLEPLIVMTKVGPENWMTFEKGLDLHPYTKYRIRCFGTCIGIFSIFAIPTHTTPTLLEFFDRLRKEGIIQGYKTINTLTNVLTVETDFSYYNPQEKWTFNWAEWKETLGNIEPERLNSPPQSVLHRLDKADMRILRQLSRDSKRKYKDVAADAEVEPYHLSRRKKAMEKKGVIQGYRVVAGMHLLQLTSHTILNCKCPTETTQRVAAAVKLLPFQSTFIQTLEGFVLYTTTTAIDFPPLVTTLLEECESVEIHWCDYRSSMRYWFHDEPFQDGKWQDDHDYMVGSVISKMDL